MSRPRPSWSWFRKLPKYRRAIGTKSLLGWTLLRYSARLRNHGPSTWRVRPRMLPKPLEVSLRGSSDFDVFNQIYMWGEYEPLRGLDNISFIVDLGANVGYSSAYFLSCFPGSAILAVEPDERNVAVCRETLKPFEGRARLVHGAAWSRPATLLLSHGTFGDGREWSTQVIYPPPGTPGAVQAWDVPSLMQLANRDRIDLLKIDVERSELEIFGDSSAAWLSRVRNLCIELHGPDCRQAFLSALQPFQYDLTKSGELLICTNLRPRPIPSVASAPLTPAAPAGEALGQFDQAAGRCGR